MKQYIIYFVGGDSLTVDAADIYEALTSAMNNYITEITSITLENGNTRKG